MFPRLFSQVDSEEEPSPLVVAIAHFLCRTILPVLEFSVRLQKLSSGTHPDNYYRAEGRGVEVLHQHLLNLCICELSRWYNYVQLLTININTTYWCLVLSCSF